MRAVIVLIAGIALAYPIAKAGAQSVDGLSSKIETAKSQAVKLNAEIEDKIVALADARSKASAALSRESELSETLAEGRERSAELAAKVDRAEQDLAEARARLERAQDALAARLVAIYKSADTNGVDVLLSADGFDDLSTRADLLGRIQDADRVLAERVRTLRDAVAERLDAAKRAKAKSDALNEKIEAARDEIAAARAAAEARAAALAQARSAQAAALGDLESRMSDWAQQVEELEQVSPEQAAEEVGSWGGSGGWAIPEAIVMCESGGNYSALNPSSGAGGAYQILPSTWAAYGGKGLPHQASPAEQDRIAALIWADSGPSAWVCAG